MERDSCVRLEGRPYGVEFSRHKVLAEIEALRCVNAKLRAAAELNANAVCHDLLRACAQLQPLHRRRQSVQVAASAKPSSVAKSSVVTAAVASLPSQRWEVLYWNRIRPFLPDEAVGGWMKWFFKSLRCVCRVRPGREWMIGLSSAWHRDFYGLPPSVRHCVQWHRHLGVARAPLRLVVLGPEGHGKSTIAARIVVASGAVDSAEMSTLREAATQCGRKELPWLFDSLLRERVTCGTILGGEWLVHTPGLSRALELHDTPSRAKYLHNRLSKVAVCDAVLLVLSAAPGEFEIAMANGAAALKVEVAAMMFSGARCAVVVVNKMDMADWCEERFRDIEARVSHAVASVAGKQLRLRFVPLGSDDDALASSRMAWWSGCGLEDLIDVWLESPKLSEGAPRFAVTKVRRRRVVEGFLLRGALRRGDVLNVAGASILPESSCKPRIESMEIYHQPIESAFPGQRVALRLSRCGDKSHIRHGVVLGDASLPAAVSEFSVDVRFVRAANLRLSCSEFLCHVHTAVFACRVSKCLHNNVIRDSGVLELKQGLRTSLIVVSDGRHHVVLEEYEACQNAMGRVLFSKNGVPLAAGVVRSTCIDACALMSEPFGATSLPEGQRRLHKPHVGGPSPPDIALEEISEPPCLERDTSQISQADSLDVLRNVQDSASCKVERSAEAEESAAGILAPPTLQRFRNPIEESTACSTTMSVPEHRQEANPAEGHATLSFLNDLQQHLESAFRHRKHDGAACYMCSHSLKASSDISAGACTLCEDCASLNNAKRLDMDDLSRAVCIVTGARGNIGYMVLLKLVRCGATVIATTRFPDLLAEKVACEDDYAEWQGRVHCYGVDLRQIPSVLRFTKHVREHYPDIHVLINSAAQNIRRPADHPEGRHHSPGLVTSLSDLATCADAALDVGRLPGLQLLDSGEWMLPACALPSLWLDGIKGDSLNASVATSSDATLQDLLPLQLLEVLFVNVVSPFILLQQTMSVRKLQEPIASVSQVAPSLPRFVINVTSPEGSFYQPKHGSHTYTSMANAALNMLTRTVAGDLARSGIFVSAVDTGWANVIQPSSERVMPLSAEDGAARVVDPVLQGLRAARSGRRPVAGALFKHFRVVPWSSPGEPWEYGPCQ